MPRIRQERVKSILAGVVYEYPFSLPKALLRFSSSKRMRREGCTIQSLIRENEQLDQDLKDGVATFIY